MTNPSTPNPSPLDELRELVWKFGFQLVLCAADGQHYYYCRECKLDDVDDLPHNHIYDRVQVKHKPDCKLANALAAQHAAPSEAAPPAYCGDCDGCGWVEGGTALKTTCETCGGTGREPSASPSASSAERGEDATERVKFDTWVAAAEHARNPFYKAHCDMCRAVFEFHESQAAPSGPGLRERDLVARALYNHDKGWPRLALGDASNEDVVRYYSLADAALAARPSAEREQDYGKLLDILGIRSAPGETFVQVHHIRERLRALSAEQTKGAKP